MLVFRRNEILRSKRLGFSLLGIGICLGSLLFRRASSARPMTVNSQASQPGRPLRRRPCEPMSSVGWLIARSIRPNRTRSPEPSGRLKLRPRSLPKRMRLARKLPRRGPRIIRRLLRNPRMRKPTDTKVVDAKTSATKPAESKTRVAGAVDAKPVDVAAAGPKLAELKPPELLIGSCGTDRRGRLARQAVGGGVLEAARPRPGRSGGLAGRSEIAHVGPRQHAALVWPMAGPSAVVRRIARSVVRFGTGRRGRSCRAALLSGRGLPLVVEEAARLEDFVPAIGTARSSPTAVRPNGRPDANRSGRAKDDSLDHIDRRMRDTERRWTSAGPARRHAASRTGSSPRWTK